MAENNNDELDERPHLNVVFIGHVDAGKSTTCGNLMCACGVVDERELEKYEREAKEKGRDSWFYAFLLDIHEEERAKGKTVEVGKATFTTPHRRFTLLDAPGHKMFVPNMISGAAQADVGVLIVSARRGEFETGFDGGGQTREHAILAKTLGVDSLIVAVNKMDDPSCDWDKDRYDLVIKKIGAFLKQSGYNPSLVSYLPISGLASHNIARHVSRPDDKLNVANASWYKAEEPTLLELLDRVPPPPRDPNADLRIPVLEGFRDSGVFTTGKVESGTLCVNDALVLMPTRVNVKVNAITVDGAEVPKALPGENVVLKLAGVEEDYIGRGSVLCHPTALPPIVRKFIGRLLIMELPASKHLLSRGYSCILHAHTAMVECKLTKLLSVTNRTNKTVTENPVYVKGNSMVTLEIELSSDVILEPFEIRQQLGRFTLRDEGVTVGIGKVEKVL